MCALKSIVGGILLVSIISTHSQWINEGTVLPRGDSNMGVAYWNNTFYLFGGFHNNRQLVTINNENQYTDHGTNVLKTSLQSTPHCYSQLSDTSIVYYIEWLGFTTNTRRIVIYDLESTNENGQIYADKNIHFGSCMTIAVDILFITGGRDYDMVYVKTTQAYNIKKSTWISDIKDMKTKRGFHACVYDPTQEQIWVIGGSDGNSGDALKSIETKLTHFSGDWQYSDELITASNGNSAVYYKGYILVLGGYNYNDRYLDTVQIINCGTRHVFMAGSLNYAVWFASAILITDTLYLFGGSNDYRYAFKTMQHFDLYCTEPIYNPTKAPNRDGQAQDTSTPAPDISLNEGGGGGAGNWSYWLIIVLSIALCFSCVVIVFVFCKLKNKRNEQDMKKVKAQHEENNMVELLLEQPGQANYINVANKHKDIEFDGLEGVQITNPGINQVKKQNENINSDDQDVYNELGEIHDDIGIVNVINATANNQQDDDVIEQVQ